MSFVLKFTFHTFFTESFYNDPVTLIAEGEIELVGPPMTAFQGGMTGTYVRTKGKSGKGKLKVLAYGAEPCEIEFTVKA